MERLECKNENWYVNDEVSGKWVTKMMLPDFRGDTKECIHMRGRGWRWLILRCDYTGLKKGQEYEFAFWGKFDYYSGYGTKSFISVYETPDDNITYDINPNSPYASACANGWYLYKIPVRLTRGTDLRLELTAFEANIAVLPAYPEDEDDARVTHLQEKDGGKPYYINEELPYSEFSCLEQRVAKYYYDLLATYHPAKEIPEACQREYYDFVNELYQKLYSRPEEYFTRLNPDDAFPNRFNNSEYGKPELKPNMIKDRNRIDELFQLLLIMGTDGEETEDGIKLDSALGRKQKKLLTYMGFDVSGEVVIHKKHPGIGQAIKYLSGKDMPLWSLQFCWFDPDYPYLENTHEKFYDRKQYWRLIDWLKENGYRRSVGYENMMTLDYAKCISNVEKPLGYALHGDKFHYGFTFEYRIDPRVMHHCELRIIKFAEMLKRFDELSEKTKKLIMLRTKICDGCRYCVQTDKTGKRPLAAIKLSDQTSRCPYYPGFNYSYERLAKDDVDDIISFLTDLERVIFSK